MAKGKGTKTEKVEKVDETPEDIVEEAITQEVVEDPNAWKELARDEVANDFFDMDFSELTEGQQEKINAQVAKMRKPRKKSAPKEPKRTSGRMIAPTLRVKDEDAILKAMYSMKCAARGTSYKGGWGTVTPDNVGFVITNTGWEPLVEGLQNLISERKIADDTLEIE